jgi:hypothetical protein
MTIEELIAAGLPIDPIVEGVENDAQAEDAGSPSGLSHPVLKAKPNALITCAPGSSYTHA